MLVHPSAVGAMRFSAWSGVEVFLHVYAEPCLAASDGCAKLQTRDPDDPHSGSDF